MISKTSLRKISLVKLNLLVVAQVELARDVGADLRNALKWGSYDITYIS